MKNHIIINNDVLRRTRKGLELTQGDMSEKLGVTRKTYARYEKEKAYLSDETVRKLSEILGIEYDALVFKDLAKEIDRIMAYSDDKLKEKLTTS